jgi:glycosyltransferase involved in cell wall biosynthesis
MGVDWFTNVGYSQDRVFPFGYFVEIPAHDYRAIREKEQNKTVVELVFVGYPLKNKGLDILFNSLRSLKKYRWRLHIVGNLENEFRFFNLSEKFDFSDRTIFYGTRPNSEVIKLISNCDLLVLPSRWDGWGAVINEALMCGVPVVCSDRCGASDLVDGHERGEVFPSESAHALRTSLERRILQGKKNPTSSKRIQAWSKCITGESAASYLLAVIEASKDRCKKPIPPWFD